MDPSYFIFPTIQVDAEGKVKYDAIARQGHGKDRVVFSKFEDLLPKEVLDDDNEELQKPDEEEVRSWKRWRICLRCFCLCDQPFYPLTQIEDNTERTRAALEKLVQGKISAAMPVRCAEKQAPAQYIRYTPSQQVTALKWLDRF